MGFQTRVNAQPVPGIAGDFAGCNPRASVIAPPGGYMAAPDYPVSFGGALVNALIVGRFAWANYATGLMANYFQPNSLLGFVHRESQTVITAFLDESRVAVQQGFPVTAHNQGDFWADFAASAPDAAGLTVYADPLTGAASAGAAGQGVTLTLTASVAGNALTVTATSGVLAAGQVVQNAALGLLPGTFITGQVSGSAGSTGVYALNQSNPVIGSGTVTAYGLQETKFKLATAVPGPAAFTGALTGTSGATFTGVIATNVLTVSALTGVLHSGDLISGAGVAAVPLGRQLTGFPGGNGTYQLTHADVGSEAMTSQSTPDGKLTVSAVGSGTLSAGMYFAGASIPGYAQITGQLPGGTPGGAGTYQTNLFELVGSEAMTANQGTNGKISTWQA